MSIDVRTEWSDILRNYPPLLTPKEAEEASGKVVSRKDVYNRNLDYKRKLPLDIRRVGGRLYVTRQSLLNTLCGEQQLPL